ncbi:MAG: alanine racemase [Anaerolineales bacterium]
MNSLRPTQLLVNLSQLRRNLLAIRQRVYPARVLVMLKANAYGHGLEGVAPFIEPEVDAIGVAVLDEGMALRRMGIRKPILVAGGCLPEQIPQYLAHDLTLTVSSLEILDSAEAAARAAGKTLTVHLKIDTGMERAGTRWYESAPLLERSLSCRHLTLEGIYTHFANSETPESPALKRKRGYTAPSAQLERFAEVLDFYARRSLPPPPLRHAANSGAILNLPQSFFDMVRPGILFYGIYPGPDCAKTVEVAPAATWISRVFYSKITRAQAPVSYGSLWNGATDVTTVTVPCGYADGYFRRNTNRASVIVNGKKYLQVGRICMDQFMVNLGGDTARLGDEVILLGRAASGAIISPEDLAEWAGTNAYEVMTNISARVPRVFLRGDTVQ